MPQINLGKVTLTDADLIAKPLTTTSQADDNVFITQDDAVKRFPVDHLPGGDGGATPVKVVDIAGGSIEDIDFSAYLPGDVVLVIQSGAEIAVAVSEGGDGA